MSVNLMKDWLNISWNRTQRMLFIKNMLVLEPFKQHLAPLKQHLNNSNEKYNPRNEY